MNDATVEIVLREENVLAHFSEFEQSLAKFRDDYGSRVYDLSDPGQDKAARSDRLAIGRVIAALDRKHKEVKEPLLTATRLVDGRRKEIKDQLLEVQDHIKAQIEAHEQREQDRIDAIHACIGNIRELTNFSESPDSVAISKRLTYARAVMLDDSWQEFRADAALARTEVIEALESMLAERLEAEAEAAELTRLRAEAEAKERLEREERIAREAAEAAKREAEELAAREAGRVEREKIEAAAAAQKALDEAAAKAKREQDEANAAAAKAVADAQAKAQAAEMAAAQAAADERARIEREQAEQARKAEQERKADEARKAKRQHRAKIHSEAKAALIEHGIADDTATLVVELIRDGKVAHVAIAY